MHIPKITNIAQHFLFQRANEVLMSIVSPRLFTLAALIFSFFITNTSFAMSNLSTGAHTSIASYVGKDHWTIVQAWKSDCGICNTHMPTFVKNARRFPNTKVIGVSLDGNRQIAKNFVSKHGVNFPTLLSNKREFNQYLRRVAKEGLTGTPTYLVFNPQGKLIALQPGHVPFASIYNLMRRSQ